MTAGWPQRVSTRAYLLTGDVHPTERILVYLSRPVDLRWKLSQGSCPGATLFKSAHRIMSDLVILLGVAGPIRTGMCGIERYRVEFSNEDRHGFDLKGVDSMAEC